MILKQKLLQLTECYLAIQNTSHPMTERGDSSESLAACFSSFLLNLVNASSRLNLFCAQDPLHPPAAGAGA
jgi:hypothetical protein